MQIYIPALPIDLGQKIKEKPFRQNAAGICAVFTCSETQKHATHYDWYVQEVLQEVFQEEGNEIWGNH